MATLQVRVVTPDGSVLDEEVESVVLPAVEGEMEVLPGHIPMIVQVKPGELRVRREGKYYEYAIGEGFAEITGKQVSLATDTAVKESDINEKTVEEAIKRAEEAIRSQALKGEELEATQAVLARSLVQLHLKRRRAPRT
ncbi:MAG: ATP synthase F1 subunit epsilon [Methylacidiphilales bacterium]|nr:ATP synthase F1 subunit epsilon [Candidatus Methylacidiphilales bacterium]MDW8348865.1 ATP synthase F1 subunit epsilon [Verrucomicrobiae bacterium]